MPNIEDINGVAAADIGAFSGVSASNIAKVDGVDLVTFTGLLDTYTGAAAGYSVRQLKGGVTICMRVRRETAGGAGDDDEADVRFDTSLATPTISLDSAISNASFGVTATTLGQFLNVGTVGGTTYTNPDSLTATASCFVDEWKDQSGNANHAQQTVLKDQPQIHSGTVNTDLNTENGKPIIKNSGAILSRNCLEISSLSFSTNNWGFGVCLVDQSFSNWIEGPTANDFVLLAQSGSGSSAHSGVSGVSLYKDGSTWSATSRSNVYTDLLNNQSLVVANWSSSSWTSFNLGYPSSDSVEMHPMQEFVLWTTDQSSNRTGIETNINGYFSIF